MYVYGFLPFLFRSPTSKQGIIPKFPGCHITYLWQFQWTADLRLYIWLDLSPSCLFEWHIDDSSAGTVGPENQTEKRRYGISFGILSYKHNI